MRKECTKPRPSHQSPLTWPLYPWSRSRTVYPKGELHQGRTWWRMDVNRDTLSLSTFKEWITKKDKDQFSWKTKSWSFRGITPVVNTNILAGKQEKRNHSIVYTDSRVSMLEHGMQTHAQSTKKKKRHGWYQIWREVFYCTPTHPRFHGPHKEHTSALRCRACYPYTTHIPSPLPQVTFNAYME